MEHAKETDENSLIYFVVSQKSGNFAADLRERA
jgi:hypothetical protein